jgi:hypothetical protein
MSSPKDAAGYHGRNPGVTGRPSFGSGHSAVWQFCAPPQLRQPQPSFGLNRVKPLDARVCGDQGESDGLQRAASEPRRLGMFFRHFAPFRAGSIPRLFASSSIATRRASRASKLRPQVVQATRWLDFITDLGTCSWLPPPQWKHLTRTTAAGIAIFTVNYAASPVPAVRARRAVGWPQGDSADQVLRVANCRWPRPAAVASEGL